MGNEILEKTSKEVFQTIERWEAFLELVSKKSEIEKYWYKKFAEHVVKKEVPNEKWLCNYNNSKHLYWQLKSSRFNDESLSIWAEKNIKGEIELILWASSKHYNINEINRVLFEDGKYQPIRDVFNVDKRELDEWEHEYIFRKKIEFYNSNSIISNESLSWYMGINPEIIYSQLMDEINKLTSIENTKLLENLHSSCILKYK